MLDMGFEPSIKKIMFDIRPDRLVCLTRYFVYFVIDQFMDNVECYMATWSARTRSSLH